jgi:hypothetical protein
MASVVTVNDLLDGHVSLDIEAPPAPDELRHALATIDGHLHGYIEPPASVSPPETQESLPEKLKINLKDWGTKER